MDQVFFSDIAAISNRTGDTDAGRLVPSSDFSFWGLVFLCGVSGVGGVAIIGVVAESMANQRNECGGGARKRAIAAIDQAKLTPEIDVGYFDQFDFAGANFVARKARAD